MIADALQLSPAHRYSMDGRGFISVTQALKAAELIETEWFSEAARLRGQHVHEACMFVDDDDLDSTDPSYAPYVAAYDAFLRDAKPQWAYIEQRVCDPVCGYAGTFDRVGFLNGNWALLDLKTGDEAAWHGPQTAAYARLVPTANGLKPKRFGLYLRKDGTYRLQPFPDRNDEKVFLAALTVAQFKETHGIGD